jgi:hypothetical protein
MTAGAVDFATAIIAAPIAAVFKREATPNRTHGINYEDLVTG